jgi:peptide/nickel transport system substrate-binding protein
MARARFRGFAVTIALIIAACTPAAQSPGSPTAGAPSQTGAASADAGPTGQVTIAIGSDPVSLDPQARDDSNGHVVRAQIFESLTNRESSMEIGPGLAESWDQVDDTAWQFTLREGVTFHNGEPFNADAVVYSIERINDPGFDKSFEFASETISGATAIDETTVEIETNGADPILPSRLDWLAMVPPEASANADFAENPIGTGPYKFVEWRRGSQISLTANEDYWGPAPSIKDVVIRTIPEANTALAALQTGEIDLVKNLFPEQLGQVPKVAATPGLESFMIRLNTWGGETTELLVRQALNYAIDKDAIAEALFGGYAETLQGQAITSSEFGFNPDLEPYPYDPDMARDLLGQAGFESLDVNFVGTSGNWLKDKEVTEAVAGQLEEVGIHSNLSILELSAYYNAMLNPEKASQAELAFISVSGELLDAQKTLNGWFACEGAANVYCNEVIDQMIADARVETDSGAREQLLQETWQALRDDAASIFLVSPQNIWGLTERLQYEPRIDSEVRVADMQLTE